MGTRWAVFAAYSDEHSAAMFSGSFGECVSWGFDQDYRDLPRWNLVIREIK